ncbi:MAG: hypothetical protein IH986_11445 [Planctomycetes bacterium]|nr:hypothetical protein [Planctomycetota bacterium]
MALLGLVFDAENDRNARIAEIKKWLRGAGFKPPKAPLQVERSSLGDTVVRTAYLINPHDEERGAIETYFLPQVRRAQRWPCIQRLLTCYDKQEPTDVLKEKLIVRTFIAHKNGRNTGLNAAFNANILSCDDDSFEPVRRFLSLLREASPVEQGGKRTKRR